MILWKDAQKQDGNFIVIISFIATAFVLFFALFSYIAKSYLAGQEDSKITLQAGYAAESIIERLPYEYNQKTPLTLAKTILHEKEKFCKNFSFDVFKAHAEQAVLDFGPACSGENNTVSEIGDGRSRVVKFASRMTDEENGYLDRYQLFEYRLTRYEFLENLHDKAFEKPEKLLVSWWDDKNPKLKNPKIEFILASWEQEDNKLINSNISIQRLVPRDDQVQFDQESGKNSFEITDFSKDLHTALFCNKDCNEKPKEYILFIKSFYQPLHISIQGFPHLNDTKEKLKERTLTAQKKYEEALASGDETAIQENEDIFFREAFKIPSRYLNLESSAIIENEENPLKDFVKTVKAKKEMYRDFDSNFPYTKYEIR